jgi:predicted HAD superfamily Cof-like phosphohydrolase
MTNPTKTDKVKDFHAKFNFSMDIPLADDDILRKRMMIFDEEVREFRDAVAEGDPEHILKELCDVLYATIGFGVCYGLPVDAAFDRVHQSNMSKSPTAIIDGKAIKGEGYFTAKLDDLIKPNKAA